MACLLRDRRVLAARNGAIVFELDRVSAAAEGRDPGIDPRARNLTVILFQNDIFRLEIQRLYECEKEGISDRVLGREHTAFEAAFE